MAEYSLDDLLYLMQRLRDPNDGCPWDQAQDFASIIPFTLEECYELADAIDDGDLQQIRDEMGDLLFQVVFLAQIASDQDSFHFNDVVTAIVQKLLRRHPHVFPDGTLQSRAANSTVDTAEIKSNWEAIKAEERHKKSLSSILDDVPKALPALSRATKLQKRASNVGFDWHEAKAVLAHVRSELQELEEAITEQNPENMDEELGDLLFCMANLGRHLKLDPENSLRAANKKFERRFGYIEDRLKEQGSDPLAASLEEMDALWEQAKQKGL